MAATKESGVHKSRLNFPAWKGLDIETPDWGLECRVVSKLAHPADQCMGNGARQRRLTALTPASTPQLTNPSHLG